MKVFVSFKTNSSSVASGLEKFADKIKKTKDEAVNLVGLRITSRRRSPVSLTTQYNPPFPPPYHSILFDSHFGKQIMSNKGTSTDFSPAFPRNLTTGMFNGDGLGSTLTKRILQSQGRIYVSGPRVSIKQK